MRYLLILNVQGQTAYQMYTWPEDDLRAHFAFLRRFNQKLVESGELVGIEALTAPDQAKRVRAGPDGRPVTDGVFPETKEFLAGFWTVDVESPERAYQLAAEASAAPGPGGQPLNMVIEVRQVMTGAARDLM